MKRKRELALQDKKRRKFERRCEKNSDRPGGMGHEPGHDSVHAQDPDIAHIVPGPQPLPWDDQGLPPLEATSEPAPEPPALVRPD